MTNQLDDITKDEFFAGEWTDEELASLAYQTGVETINAELAQIEGLYPHNRWRMSMQSRNSGFWQWHDSSPLRAVAGCIVAAYLADREADEYDEFRRGMCEAN